jgi:protein SCO1/2
MKKDGSMRRGLIWGLLVVALLAVTAATIVQRRHRSEPPPDLGQVPAFALTNRDGRPVRLADLAGQPWIADFVFTRCPASCPMMTARMARLNGDLPTDLPVRLVSFSVDPVHDTPAVLQAYAAKYGATERWLFLTGPLEEIRRLSVDGFKLGFDPAPAPGTSDEPVVHSTRFVLVDGEGHIRGYYDGFDKESVAKLKDDVRALADR